MSGLGELGAGYPEQNQLADLFKAIGRRLKALETAQRGSLSSDGTTTFLRSGDFKVTGGSISVSEDGSFDIIAADGKKLADFDKDAVTFYNAAEAPLSVLDRSGVRVGPDVELAAAGLRVIGGFVTPIHPDRKESVQTGVTLTTTQSVKASITFTPPSWVETLLVIWSTAANSPSDGSAPRTVTVFQSDNDSAAFESYTYLTASGITDKSRSGTRLHTMAGSTYTLNVHGLIGSGSLGSHIFKVSAAALGLRS